jgi:hypothetical protein
MGVISMLESAAHTAALPLAGVVLAGAGIRPGAAVLAGAGVAAGGVALAAARSGAEGIPD